ncbi:L-threonylcarbamoyladenylate synthase [Compostibacter hankyongensis]|uniref:L-threonylcarbamoyladenylate synthase n=1 Tax=Compostibacter hankyongensis TaxID=1007089 RepID=A0ABP8FWT1_9BACT
MSTNDPAFGPSVEGALATLRAGGLILYPTDTIWGIGCDATHAEAIRRIYALKRRDDRKSLILLLADERSLMQYVTSPPPDLHRLLQETGRPTTVIYEGAVGLPDNLVPADGSIAIRLVQEPFCKTLIKRLRKPLVSTSANISGQPSPGHFGEIAEEIRRGVDFVVPYRQDDRTKTAPSRIVKITTDGALKIIRE